MPPPSAANIHVVPLGACHTAGAVKSMLLDGVADRLLFTAAVRPGLANRVAASSRIVASLPLCANRPPPSRTGDVDPTSTSPALSCSVLEGV